MSGLIPTTPPAARTARERERNGERMKTDYEYIHFVRLPSKRKTLIYSCRNNRSKYELGIIKWYSAWRQYAYFPTVQAVYSSGCLADITVFIRELHYERAQLEREIENA